MEEILSLGIAPALQRTMVFDSFAPGAVNRAKEVVLTPAGKAVNIARALVTLGDTVVVTGFNGGDSGKAVAAGLRRSGIRTAFCRMEAATRVCTTIVDLSKSGEASELVEESPKIDEDGWRRFAAVNRRELARARMLVVSGTLPPGAPDNLYADFARMAEERGVPLVIDSHKAGILAVLPYHPLVAKMNLHELRLTFGDSCEDEASTLASAARLTAAGASWAFITNGADPGWLLAADGRAWRIVPPRLEAVLNPIGSGDSVTAGLADAWLRGHPMPDAARFATACGSANAINLRPAEFTPAQVRRLTRRAKSERI